MGHPAPSENAEFLRDRGIIVTLIENHIDSAMQNRPPFQTFSDDMTPSEFETFCAEELRRSGWNARVTIQSRDQGVDVIAEKHGVRVVLQCKLYSNPVGNKAVQEAAAGKAHEQAHHGVVVTNNRFTPAAEQLASTNEILLLHYRDLRDLDNLLRGVCAKE
ncbi:MAG: restriction endonuclease [Acidobacteria bacterium]|nr:MAG: restriction endonuclease [Acidobacteriota bacterium]